MAFTDALPISGLLALSLCLGCATAPAPVAKSVRTEFEEAARDPIIREHAAIQLNDAQQSLARLEATPRGERAELAHLAYVTRQRIAIAHTAAELGVFEADVAALGAQRDRLRLDARTQEADVARADSAESRADANAARNVAVARTREADDARAESAESRADASAARTESAASMADAAGARLAAAASSRDAERAREDSAASAADASSARGEAASAIDRARALESRVSDLSTEQTERGLVMTMRGVLFQSGRAEILPGAERALGEVAGLLNDYPDRRVDVEGHTDSVGGTADNQRLSERRAGSVAAFLVRHGVATARIESRGLGETMPLASNDDDAGRQANRRVEIVLIAAPAKTSQR